MNNLDVNAVIVKHYRFHGYSIRAIVQHHQTWFAAEDICELLGFDDPIRAVGKLDDSDVIKLNYWDVQKSLPILISEIWDYHTSLNKYLIDEFGVSNLLIHSKVSNADPICYWLTRRLMPSIIPTGNPKANDAYEHHKRLLIRFGWRMLQSARRDVQP